MERKLSEVIEALVVSYTGAKDKERAVKDSLEVVKGVVDAALEIAQAAVVAAECSKAGHHKRYEARYYISAKGVNGNLVRSWEVPELPEGAEEAGPPPPGHMLILLFREIHLCLR
jgi:hypothetical protein